MKKAGKILLGVIGSLLGLCLILFLIYKLCLDPHRGVDSYIVNAKPLDQELTAEQVREDMDYVLKRLRERHPAWLEDENARVEELENCYQAECEKISSGEKTTYTVLDEWRILAGILNKLHDGHTSIQARYEDYHELDCKADFAAYGFPVRINGEPIEDIYDRFLNLFFYETDSYADNYFYDNLIFREHYLKLWGIETSPDVTFTYLTPEGEKEITYPWVSVDLQASSQNSDEKATVLTYEVDPEEQIAVFDLRQCDYTDAYCTQVKAFFTEVKDNNVTDIIVNLMDNPGGNSNVANEFLSYLDIDGYKSWSGGVRYGNYLYRFAPQIHTVERNELTYSGHLYVLTNAQTFSSAMDFAMLILDNDLGTLVGEPSGNLPDSYGDILRFHTPNADLAFSVSHKRWYRIDQTKAGQPIMPQVLCAPEEAMEKACELIRESR